MIALDTNVVVRYLTMDDAAQSARAEALIEAALERGERLYLSLVVLCEIAWVLERAYGLDRAALGAALDGLLRAAQFEIEGADLAHRALKRFGSGAAGFADYVVLEASIEAGCATLVTFDKRLQRSAEASPP